MTPPLAVVLAVAVLAFVAVIATLAYRVCFAQCPECRRREVEETERLRLGNAYYLRNMSPTVGNVALWWKRDGRGYTTDLDQAHIFTQAEVERGVTDRDEDVAWPADEIDKLARLTVDGDLLERNGGINQGAVTRKLTRPVADVADAIEAALADSERCERLEGALGVIFNQISAIRHHLAEEHNDPFPMDNCSRAMKIIELLGVPPANKETREALQAYLDALSALAANRKPGRPRK